MIRVNKIIENKMYWEHLDKIEVYEKDREFCRHNIGHFLDVCRIAWILNLEGNLALSKEVIYATGLLHDIGRWLQYENGEDHALASERLCEEILINCDFNKEETQIIKEAIRNHRKPVDGENLNTIIYKGDKLSRACFNCKAINECKNFKLGEKPILIY